MTIDLTADEVAVLRRVLAKLAEAPATETIVYPTTRQRPLTVQEVEHLRVEQIVVDSDGNDLLVQAWGWTEDARPLAWIDVRFTPTRNGTFRARFTEKPNGWFEHVSRGTLFIREAL